MDEFGKKDEGHFYAVDSAFGKPYALQGFSTKENDEQEELSLQALTEIDYRLAYFTEKLVNLNVLYIYLLSEESDLEAMDSKNNCILAQLFEKAMSFDLLAGILDSEVRELDSFMDALQEEIVIARQKIFSCRHLTELFLMMDKKLHDSEESVKQFQQQLMELKMQSSQLQKTMDAYRNENCETGKALNLSGNGQLSDVKAKPNDQMVEQRRYILQMLEKSFARELALERKLAESKDNEDLKLKLRYTEQVAFYMEEAAEVVWGRFLEADNAAEVLMGISKGIMGRLQVTEFNLSSSMQRENELRSTVQNLMEQIKAKDAALDKLETCNVESTKEKSDVLALREKVKFLEKEREDFELQINNAIAENEVYHEHQIEMENFVESLRENIDIALSRAESAEAKVTQLTETNLELTEEINFLKGSASTAEKKVGSLEKQLRELDIQLQTAKASSEASQEQQNMLYTAIWDMEILIEELKSKVSKAESNNESAAEKCSVLSQTNLELHKELDLLRSRTICLKTSLDQASHTSFSRAKEIDTKTKLIMDMVMQLAAEREHINNQLLALKQENKHLVQKLKNTKIDGSLHTCNYGLNNRNEDQASNIDSSNDSCAKSSDEEVIDHFNAAFQVGEEIASSKTGVASSISADKLASCRKLTFLSVAFFVPLVSVLAIWLLDKGNIFISESL
ncbi:WPP domain-interacting tail-anchored protein 2 isoform X1 [Vigna radiata var. radiata]|uniref:WPP domain-interacting tail-anchored protein 2 isoform X1 n=1 Tax=Vigna radiata var. radiata TaxID=3916 RepID=A0A1S3VSD1_VIGRR|nr:WPP domain-interacting tail-anchored protein 2 isoform X1 [Vigna radiata var. radiata]XP_022643143.1 WPP domain-interacting tail-anchored protein 2 isoform X1 [Vigna radiata var. radiata]